MKMIIVNIYMPALDKEFDIQVPKSITIDAIKYKIIDMLNANEDNSYEYKKFIMASSDQKEILDGSMSIDELSLGTGCRIILV